MGGGTSVQSELREEIYREIEQIRSDMSDNDIRSKIEEVWNELKNPNDLPTKSTSSIYGKYEFKNGDIYIGEWKSKIIHGKGKYITSNGDFYQGYFVKGRKHGDGTQTYSNGNLYSGTWANDEMNGFGKYSYDEKTQMYHGNFRNSLRHGAGIFYYGSGDLYDGSWSNDCRHGSGKLLYKDGSVYNGNWRNDIQDGMGKFDFVNGDIYHGEWRNGVKHGKGKFLGVNSDRYTGDWKYDLMHGQGELHRSNGDSYVGQWELGLMHGEGCYSSLGNGNNEDVNGGEIMHSGLWIHGKPHKLSPWSKSCATYYEKINRGSVQAMDLVYNDKETNIHLSHKHLKYFRPEIILNISNRFVSHILQHKLNMHVQESYNIARLNVIQNLSKSFIKNVFEYKDNMVKSKVIQTATMFVHDLLASFEHFRNNKTNDIDVMSKFAGEGECDGDGDGVQNNPQNITSITKVVPTLYKDMDTGNTSFAFVDVLAQNAAITAVTADVTPPCHKNIISKEEIEKDIVTEAALSFVLNVLTRRDKKIHNPQQVNEIASHFVAQLFETNVLGMVNTHSVNSSLKEVNTASDNGKLKEVTEKDQTPSQHATGTAVTAIRPAISIPQHDAPNILACNFVSKLFDVNMLRQGRIVTIAGDSICEIEDENRSNTNGKNDFNDDDNKYDVSDNNDNGKGLVGDNFTSSGSDVHNSLPSFDTTSDNLDNTQQNVVGEVHGGVEGEAIFQNTLEPKIVHMESCNSNNSVPGDMHADTDVRSEWFAERNVLDRAIATFVDHIMIEANKNLNQK